jgi:Lon protease-like protein
VDDHERIRRALPQLPIFPLPGAVLLPHALVPLHVFEPRYRKMTQDCADGLKVLALAHIPDETAAAQRPPKVMSTVGVGILARIDRLPDGRFNVVLRGVQRARIEEELPSGEPYRVVRAHELSALPRDLPRAVALAEGLKRLVLALSAARAGQEMHALVQLAARAQDPGDLADIVSGALLATPRERQAALEAVDYVPRLELATQAAASALAQTASTAEAPN